MHLVPIGQFSKMTRLSVKALRLYDEIDLLRPAHVDPSSGYRYYDLGQAVSAEKIRVLRSVDMPLDEIRVIVEADEPDVARKQLIAHRERLADRLATQVRTLEYLETLIEREGEIVTYEIEIAEVAPQLVAATTVHTSLKRIGQDIGIGFGTLMQGMARERLAPAGAPFVIYTTVIDEESGGDIELGVPVARELPAGGDVYSRELEGGPMATAVHLGPYEGIGSAYHALTMWISEHGHEIAGPPREIYLNDPQVIAPAELLTRVEFPICAKTD